MLYEYAKELLFSYSANLTAEAELLEAIKQAHRTLGQIASQEAKFYKEHGESENAFVMRCAAVSIQYHRIVLDLLLYHNTLPGEG